MTLVRAELFKLRTTRTSWGLFLGTLALILVISTVASAAGDVSHDRDPARGLLGVAGLSQVLAPILGILAITTGSATARSRRACGSCPFAGG